VTRLLTVLVLVVLLAPALARAQGTPGPPLPAGMDMRKAPVGSWAGYDVRLTGMPPLEQRYALVGRDAATSTLELTTKGGMMGPGNVMVLRVLLDADPAHKDRVKQIVMQLGDNTPMELRPEAGQKEQFAPLDPRRLVRAEPVKVPAGSFATRHYRERTPSGQMDVWVSDEAPPLGIVKLRGSISNGPGAASYPVTLELTTRGKDARPSITRAPQAFDPGVLQNQMSRVLGGK
jgi:hypothetical protein